MKQKTLFLKQILMSLVCCTLLFSMVQPSVRAQEPETAPKTMEELQERIQAVMTAHRVPGASVVLVSQDAVLWEAALGQANTETGAPMTTETRVRIGSISKSFVALAVMQLQAQGKLQLDDRLQEVAPEIVFTNPWEESDPVRLVHLLEHTSGFEEMRLRDFVYSDPDITLAEAMDYTAPLRVSRWRPGQYFAYSSVGTAVAAYVVEKVSGQRYEDFVESQILAPLQMAQTDFFLTPDVQETLAKSYDVDGVTPVDYFHIIVRPSGSVSSTSSDMARLVQMFLNRGTLEGATLLDAAAIQRMETPTSSWAAQQGLKSGYGLNLQSTAQDGFLFWGHSGGVDGFLSNFGYLPEHGVGYFYAINAYNAPASLEIARLIRATLIEGLEPSVAPTVELSEEALQRFAGYYELATPLTEVTPFLEHILGLTSIGVSGGRLTVQSLLGGVPELVPVGDGLFRGPEDPIASVGFVPDETGRIIMQVGALNFRSVPAWQAGTRIGLTTLALVLMLSAPLFALWWVPRKLLGRMRQDRYISVRALPLMAVLILLTTLFLFLVAIGSSEVGIILNLGQMTFVSLALMVLTLLFALATVASVVQAVRAFGWEMHRGVRMHALLVSVANVIVLGYLLSWGMVGIRTWGG